MALLDSTRGAINRPDHTTQMRRGEMFSKITRRKLAGDESVQSFAITFDENAAADNPFPWINNSKLAAGGTATLVHLETGADMGDAGEYTPAENTNFIKWGIIYTFDKICRMTITLDGDMLFNMIFPAGDMKISQEAGNFELEELVSELDGEHELVFEVENIHDTDATTGTAFVRCLEEDFS